MAKHQGAWSIEFTTEPNEMDLEHIAEMIKQGYTSGQIVQDEPANPSVTQTDK